jgi:hypothetical protein
MGQRARGPAQSAVLAPVSERCRPCRRLALSANYPAFLVLMMMTPLAPRIP